MTDLIPDYARMAAVFQYCPETGEVWSKVQRGPFPPGRKVGGVFQPRKGTPYLRMRFDGHNFLLHRVAWLLMTGEWPRGEVDHADGNGLNNVWANLRLASRSEQCRNVKAASTNATGVVGVSFHRATEKYMARGRSGGKEVYLGLFPTIAEAARASKEFRDREYGAFAPTNRSYGR